MGEKDWVMGKEGRQMYIFLMYRSHMYTYIWYTCGKNLGENRCLMERDEETCMRKTQLHMVIGML